MEINELYWNWTVINRGIFFKYIIHQIYLIFNIFFSGKLILFSILLVQLVEMFIDYLYLSKNIIE